MKMNLKSFKPNKRNDMNKKKKKTMENREQKCFIVFKVENFVDEFSCKITVKIHFKLSYP